MRDWGGSRRRGRKAERDLDCEERWRDLDLDGVRLLDVRVDRDGVRRVDEDRWRDLDRDGVRLLVDEDRWRDLDRDGVRLLDVDLDVEDRWGDLVRDGLRRLDDLAALRFLRPTRPMIHLRGRR